MTVTCPYCSADAEFVDSAEVYRKSYGMMFLCRPCNAYVGCQGSSDKPIGRLANKQLRYWKVKAQEAFGNIWQARLKVESVSTKKAVAGAYDWLAEQLNIKRSDCNIGMFDVETCIKVVQICTPDAATEDQRQQAISDIHNLMRW